MAFQQSSFKKTVTIKSFCLLTAVVVYLSGCGFLPTEPENPDMKTRSIGQPDQQKMYSARTGHGMYDHYSEAFIARETGGTLQFYGGELEVLPESIDTGKVIWSRAYRLCRMDFFKRIYEFGPSGTSFSPEATLILYYNDLGPLMPNTIELKVFNEMTQAWEVAGHMTNDTIHKRFIGPISHFSRYSLSGNGQILYPLIEDEQ